MKNKVILRPDNSGIFYKKHITKYGVFYFFDKYVITEYNEGITVNFDKWRDLFFLINKYYGDTTNFGIISNRINSYSVFPTDYFYLNNMLFNLKCIAVVNNRRRIHPHIDAELVEKLICPRPFQVFQDITQAKSWISQSVPC